MIRSRRRVVHFLSRGADETGGENGWRVLPASQVPDPAGTFDLSEQPLCTHKHIHTLTQRALTNCINVWRQIYCAEMQTDFPKEYLTLRSGQTDNYSEVYGNRYAQRL